MPQLPPYDRDQLLELLRREALEFGDFILASGKKASFYLDCRNVTLDSRGANLVAAGMLERLRRHESNWPDAVGGMAIGADPVTAAVITRAGLDGNAIKGFIVRKEAKGHGTGRSVEGPVSPGMHCVILEDVVTSGGSSLRAIEQVRAFGMRVDGVLAIVDREAGGTEAFREAGIPFDALFRLSEILPD